MHHFPPSPPPNVTPPHFPNFSMTSASILKNHLHRYLFVWLYTGEGFWFFPLEMDGQFIFGYQWVSRQWTVRRFTWRLIDSYY